MDKFRKWLLAALIAWGVFSAACLTVRYIAGVARPVQYIRLTDFSICEGPDPVTGLPQEPRTTVTDTLETIYACGYLEVDNSISLEFILTHEGESKDWFIPNRRFQTGYVFEPIPQQYRRKLGHYRLEAWRYRAELAHTEFMVVESRE